MLEDDGHYITSRWLNEDPRDSSEGGDYTEEANKWPGIATIDVEDVHASETVVFFSEEPRAWTRGGRHVEFGMGLALGKEMVLVGPVENVFHTLPEVHRFETFDWARLWLKEKDKEWAELRGLMLSTGLPRPSRKQMGAIKLSSSPGSDIGMTLLP
jgi:hypothetical protein